jgi:hypothetical protein
MGQSSSSSVSAAETTTQTFVDSFNKTINKTLNFENVGNTTVNTLPSGGATTEAGGNGNAAGFGGILMLLAVAGLALIFLFGAFRK